jgi:hypothetical protein
LELPDFLQSGFATATDKRTRLSTWILATETFGAAKIRIHTCPRDGTIQREHESVYRYISVSHDYPDDLWLNYDQERNPDPLQFFAGKRIDGIESIHFGAVEHSASSQVGCWDFLQSDCGGVLVGSNGFRNVLERHAADDCQIIPVSIGGIVSQNLFAINIMNNLDCIDLKHSIHESIEYGGLKTTSIRNYAFKPNSLGNHQLVRSVTESNHGFLPNVEVVGPKLGEAIDQARLTGITLRIR